MSCSKRTYSISSSSSGTNRINFNGSNGPNKKKKKYNRATTFVPPTKFLLGGNIRDPLNLNGLQQEEETTTTAAAAATATEEVKMCKDVALPPLADFLFGGNINDPLNLKGCAAQDALETAMVVNTEPEPTAAVAVVDERRIGDAGDVATAATACERLQPRNDEERVNGDGGIVVGRPGVSGSAGVDVATAAAAAAAAAATAAAAAAAKVVNLNLNVNYARTLARKDKIVSPVVPQPYRPLKAVPFRQIITPDLGAKTLKTPKFKEKNTRFQYGNYQRYYSYRNAFSATDLRLEILEKHRDFFENKDILDIGCNVGHVSFVIARSFGARSVTGIDIDRYLVDVARKNVQYYVNCPSPYSMESPSPLESSTATTATTTTRKVDLKYKCYPVSMPILYGPIYDDSDLRNESRKTFPKNVRFVHGNYVLESETMLQAEQPQYDTILCLSVTKWIHLNWGDDGLKIAFKRMFAQLKPGGILVLEPQSWDSYKRKKSLTETIWRHYRSIQLFPHHFDRYLLSSEVGFSRCQTLAVVNHQHKGFRRAIKVFKKPLLSVHSLVSPSPIDGSRD